MTKGRRNGSRAACRRLILVSILAVYLSSLAVACGGDTRTSSQLSVADTVDGVEVLEHAARATQSVDWTMDTVAVVGGFASGPNYQFGGVTAEGLAADSAGNIYVLDVVGVRVLRFDRKGSHLGTFGRRGEGPGELGSNFAGGPQTMAMGPGDTLWIADSSNQRFTLFPVRGGEAASLPLPGHTVAIDGSMTVDSTGVLAMPTGSPFLQDTPGAMPVRPLVRYNRRGIAEDTVWVFAAPVTDAARISIGSFSPIMMWPQVFSPGYRWARFSDGGLAIQETADYEILMTDSSGKVLRIVRRNPAPRPTTEADRKVVRDSLLQPPDEEPESSTAEARRQRVEATSFAEVIPRIVEMRRDTNDRLWVGVSEEEPNSIERIDIYNREGRLLGEWRHNQIPEFFLNDGYCVLLDTDEFDAQRILIARISD